MQRDQGSEVPRRDTKHCHQNQKNVYICLLMFLYSYIISFCLSPWVSSATPSPDSAQCSKQHPPSHCAPQRPKFQTNVDNLRTTLSPTFQTALDNLRTTLSLKRHSQVSAQTAPRFQTGSGVPVPGRNPCFQAPWPWTMRTTPSPRD